ncbi:hypothetical protein MWQ93_002429 [Staphylococcus pseudintermedius]|uniref:hypothetical protein n=1 Tax=Staphylococcus pseudintermedius TaxID=283734 RepID=UPI000E27090F|nr:hypothetical protein [Staphylococcus pseudintermedius]EJA1898731.1 hypothetical protein [Staphylococcus pseudintermedius]REA72615.1 hypothetical protein DV960_00865 [Staphylococcus pseudintermedius]
MTDKKKEVYYVAETNTGYLDKYVLDITTKDLERAFKVEESGQLSRQKLIDIFNNRNKTKKEFDIKRKTVETIIETETVHFG